MGFVPVMVDRSLREHMAFKDATFPVDVWADRYDAFVDETLNCHWHPEFEYGVLVSGGLDFYIGGVHMALRQGECVFVNSNTMHTARQAAGSRGAVIRGVAFPASLFAGDVGGSVYQKYFAPLLGRPLQGFVAPEGSQIATLVRELNGLNDTAFGYELRCMGLLHTLWQATLEHVESRRPGLLEQTGNGRHEARAKSILSYIHQHYAEPLTIEGIARHASVSRSECFRCFKRFTNKKPMEYVLEYRLAAAAKLLRETELSVAEVGAACGFATSSYFGKLFKQCYGQTPSQYRQGPPN